MNRKKLQLICTFILSASISLSISALAGLSESGISSTQQSLLNSQYKSIIQERFCTRSQICSFTEVARMNNYAIFIVKVQGLQNAYGELVDLDKKIALNFIGNQPSCSIGEGGCSNGINVSAGFFRQTFYGNTLATFQPSGLSIDLCGINRTISYLSRPPRELPTPITAEYNDMKVTSFSGSTVNFTQHQFNYSIDLGDLVVSVEPTSSFQLASQGAQSGVFRIQTIKGTRYFYGGYPTEEYFLNPDNTFSSASDLFCEK